MTDADCDLIEIDEQVLAPADDHRAGAADGRCEAHLASVVLAAEEPRAPHDAAPAGSDGPRIAQRPPVAPPQCSEPAADHEIGALTAGTLTTESRRRLTEHVVRCESCQDVLAALIVERLSATPEER